MPEWCLQWPARAPKLVDEILHWSADIICLQAGHSPDSLYGPCLQIDHPWEPEITLPCFWDFQRDLSPFNPCIL